MKKGAHFDKRILILHPCIEDAPTKYSLLDKSLVSLLVTGSDNV